MIIVIIIIAKFTHTYDIYDMLILKIIVMIMKIIYHKFLVLVSSLQYFTESAPTVIS